MIDENLVHELVSYDTQEQRCKSLLCKVLAGAIDDIHNSDKRNRISALQWFNGDSLAPLSFSYIMEMLNLDASWWFYSICRELGINIPDEYKKELGREFGKKYL